MLQHTTTLHAAPIILVNIKVKSPFQTKLLKFQLKYTFLVNV